ncbi:hypothetical protein [Falsibacillus albus]|nr:hypothetical protein [Falsibacillus albus]
MTKRNQKAPKTGMQKTNAKRDTEFSQEFSQAKTNKKAEKTNQNK